jgi:hypothetical protein
MTVHRGLIMAAFVGAALFLCGCHPTPPTPTEPATPAASITDACTLLTPPEISTAIGVPIDPGKHVVPTSAIMCSWPQTGATGETATRVMANFTSLDSFTKEKTPTNPRVTITPASGIGDEAFYVTTDFGISLYTKKGNTAFVVGVHDMALPPNEVKAKEKTLALNAAARL